MYNIHWYDWHRLHDYVDFQMLFSFIALQNYIYIDYTQDIQCGLVEKVVLKGLQLIAEIMFWRILSLWKVYSTHRSFLLDLYIVVFMVNLCRSFYIFYYQSLFRLLCYCYRLVVCLVSLVSWLSLLILSFVKYGISFCCCLTLGLGMAFNGFLEPIFFIALQYFF